MPNREPMTHLLYLRRALAAGVAALLFASLPAAVLAQDATTSAPPAYRDAVRLIDL